MKRRTIFFISIFFVVIATIFVIPPMLRTLRVTPLTLSSQPSTVTASEPVIAPNRNTNDAITLLAVTENEKGDGLQARPVNPTTLDNLPGFAPINFGHHYTYVVSPDRKTLAVITWPCRAIINSTNMTLIATSYPLLPNCRHPLSPGLSAWLRAI